MKATVLVVEDEEKLRRVIELQLKTAGFEVEQAGTAEDALKLADNADVIITDLRLPGLSGLEMLQQLRGQDVVFVRSAADRFTVRPLRTGQTSGGQTPVLEGLQPGEQIVVKGSFVLRSHLLRASIEGQ